MLHRAGLLLFAFCAAARADLPPMENDLGEVVVAQSPADEPSDADVLRWLPPAARNNIMIERKLLVLREGPVRFYPVVGKARMVESTFKCRVYSDTADRPKAEDVYVRVNRLRPAP
jgi:hypothetical protein